jgi:transposase
VNPGHLEAVRSSDHPRTTFLEPKLTDSQLKTLAWPTTLLAEFGIDTGVEYRDIPGFIGYRAGADGSIWSCWSLGKKAVLNYRWRQLRTSSDKTGRLQVGLKVASTKKTFRVHRLVLEAFRGSCPDGREACHGNNNPSDNRIDNLRWGTREENLADFLTDTEKRAGALKKVRKLTLEQAQEIRATDMARFTLEEVAAKFGVHPQTISDILAGKKYREVGGKDLRMPRGFHRRGEKNGSAKLTDAQRRAIHATDFSKYPLAKKKALARQFKVSLTTIYNVLKESPDNKNYNAQRLTEQEKAQIRAAEAGKPRRGSVSRKEALAKEHGVSLVLIYRVLRGAR